MPQASPDISGLLIYQLGPSVRLILRNSENQAVDSSSVRNILLSIISLLRQKASAAVLVVKLT